MKLCQEAGGPFQCTGRELGEAHKDLRITSDEFDEVGAETALLRPPTDGPQRPLVGPRDRNASANASLARSLRC